MTSAPVTEVQPVVLTAHPLQRVGAFAVASLAGKRHPDDVADGDLELVVEEMRRDLLRTAGLEDSKQAGGFWLGASYLLWPNSKINPTKRKRQTPAERREEIGEWRALPAAEAVIDAPCALCGRPACGFFGKVDVPLGESALYRNTTARGQDGLPLCRGCLVCFHALPYGCAIAKGKANALHSWDDRFLSKTVRQQVHRTRQDAAVAAGRFGANRPYAREVAALAELRGYDDRLAEGLELMVFSNSNKEQTLDVHPLEQPLAEWLRSVPYRGQFGRGWTYLVRAHTRKTVPGWSLLARSLFASPSRVIGTATGYLTGLAEELSLPPGETSELGDLCWSYAIEVLGMKEADATDINRLAADIAEVVDIGDATRLKGFVQANRKMSDLRKWLRKEAVARTLSTGRSEPFITDRQWRLLFDSGDDGFLHRDLLLIRTLMDLQARDPKWRSDDPEVRTDLEDMLDQDDPEEGL